MPLITITNTHTLDLSCASWYTVRLMTNSLAILTHQIVAFTGYFTPHSCKHHNVIRSPVDNHKFKSRCCERLMEMQNICLVFVHRQITWFRLKCMDRSVLSAAIITDIVNQDQCICWWSVSKIWGTWTWAFPFYVTSYFMFSPLQLQILCFFFTALTC